MADDRGLLLAREREHELALAALLQPALERAQLGVAVTLGGRDQLLVHVVELENGRCNLADERRHMPTSEPLHRQHAMVAIDSQCQRWSSASHCIEATSSIQAARQVRRPPILATATAGRTRSDARTANATGPSR